MRDSEHGHITIVLEEESLDSDGRRRRLWRRLIVAARDYLHQAIYDLQISARVHGLIQPKVPKCPTCPIDK